MPRTLTYQDVVPYLAEVTHGEHDSLADLLEAHPSVDDGALADAGDVRYVRHDGEWITIATVLRSRTEHCRDTNALALRALLVNGFRALWWDDEAGKLAGPIVDAIAASESDELKDGWRQYKSNEHTESQKITATDPEIGELITGIAETLKGIVSTIPRKGGAKAPADVDAAIEELTGGQVFAGVTNADVTEVIATHERDEAYRRVRAWKAAIDDAVEAAALQPSATPESLKQAAIDGWSAATGGA